MKPSCFRLTIDSNVEDAVLASTMIRGLLDQLRVDSCDADMVELCLTEALVNAVLHAYRGESGFEVVLEVEMEPGAIVMEVVTTGESTTREALEIAAEQATHFDAKTLEDLPEGGRGMLIIAEGMDQWDYFRRDGADVLRMRKVLGGNPRYS
jgi:serine/threonine-protein kinase RsbW